MPQPAPRTPRRSRAREQGAVLLSFVAALLAPPSFAAERVLRLDPDSGSVAFRLGATGHAVEGSFTPASGEIRFDPASGKASGSITLDARSATTGNTRRDRKMHRSVLESERFPSIVLRFERLGSPIALPGEGRAELEAVLSIHGEEHPLLVQADYQATDERVEAAADLAIPYVAWGLDDPSVFVLRVAKVVDVHIEIRGRLETPEADTARVP